MPMLRGHVSAPRDQVVVVFRALPGLGDFLCAVPTLRALRAGLPRARIHLIGLDATLPLARRFRRYVDRFHPFPGRPGLPDQAPASPAEQEAFGRAMRELDADLAIQLHGTGRVANEIVASFGARAMAGFHPPDAAPPDPERFLPWDGAERESARGLRLLRALGLPADDERLEFPLDPDARAAAAARLAAVAGRKYVVVHPGSARLAARWSPTGFEAVAARLRGTGLQVVLTGSASEQPLTAALAARVDGALDLAGATDLDELGWILRGARLLVANDTGVAHLAAALDVPSVVIFDGASGEHRRRWSAPDANRHRAVDGSLSMVLDAADVLLHATGTAA